MASSEKSEWSRNIWLVIGILAFGYLAYSVYARYVIPSLYGDAGQQLRNVKSTGHSTFVLPDSKIVTSADRKIANVDPSNTGWDTESVSAAISRQLKNIGDPSKSLDSISADSFSGSMVPPEALETFFENGPIVARRVPRDLGAFKTTHSLKEQITSLIGTEPTNPCKFKVTNIALDADGATSHILMEAVHKTNNAIEQSNLVGKCDWELTATEPKLRRFEIISLERVTFSAGGEYLFEDVTGSAFGSLATNDKSAFEEQVLRDTSYWSERLCAIDDMSIFGHHGLSVGDVNLDGLPDIYVCDSGGLPNRLYLQNADGTLRDHSKRSNIDWMEATSSALLVDLDNDGDADIAVATVAGIVIAENDGKGEFRVRAAIPEISDAYSMAAADFDNDGNLDLYVTAYGPSGSSTQARGFEAAAPIPYHDANNGGANLLLRNRGKFQFTNVTANVGLDQNNRRFSFAASWEDFDSDGDMDLYVANDFGRNNLYRNNDGRFHDVAAQLGVEDMAGGMSVSWGDANQDGLMDIYVGNMFSAAGNRVTYQRQFLDKHSVNASTGLQRMARGNTLFVAQENGDFADVSQSAGVLMGRWAWSSKFGDVNNDGREDLVVANGYFTNERADDL